MIYALAILLLWAIVATDRMWASEALVEYQRERHERLREHAIELLLKCERATEHNPYTKL